MTSLISQCNHWHNKGDNLYFFFEFQCSVLSGNAALRYKIWMQVSELTFEPQTLKCFSAPPGQPLPYYPFPLPHLIDLHPEVLFSFLKN